MTATVHAVVGTFIAARFVDPYAAVPIAFASHYTLDMVPHWDSATNRVNKSDKKLLLEALIDTLIAVTVSFVLYGYLFDLENYSYLILIVGVSLLPDVVTFLTRFVFKKKNILWNWNNRLQIKLNRRLQLPWGILTQIIAVGVVYLVLFRVFI